MVGGTGESIARRKEMAAAKMHWAEMESLSPLYSQVLRS